MQGSADRLLSHVNHHTLPSYTFHSHHRPLFDSLESTTFLYQRFLILNANFDLIEPELLIIPTASEGVREEVRTAGEASAEEDSEQPQESREEVS